MTAPTTFNATVSALAALSLGSANDGSTEVQNTMPLTLLPPGNGAGNSMLGSINFATPISPLLLEFDISRPTTIQDNDKTRNDVDSGSISGSDYHSNSHQRRLGGLVSMTVGDEGRKRRTARSELRALQKSALRSWGLNKPDTNSSSRRELGQDIRQAVATSTKVNTIEAEVIATGFCRVPELDTGLVVEHSTTFEEAWDDVPLITFTPINGSNFQDQEMDTASMISHSSPSNEARNEKNGPEKKEVKREKVVAEKGPHQRTPIDKKTGAQRRKRRNHLLKARDLRKKFEAAGRELAKKFFKVAESDLARIKAAENKTAENKTAENKTAENKTAENKTAESKAVLENYYSASPPPPPPSSHSIRIEKMGVTKKKKSAQKGAKKKMVTEREIDSLSFLIDGLNVDGAAVTEGSEETKT